MPPKYQAGLGRFNITGVSLIKQTSMSRPHADLLLQLYQHRFMPQPPAVTGVYERVRLLQQHMSQSAPRYARGAHSRTIHLKNPATQPGYMTHSSMRESAIGGRRWSHGSTLQSQGTREGGASYRVSPARNSRPGDQHHSYTCRVHLHNTEPTLKDTIQKSEEPDRSTLGSQGRRRKAERRACTPSRNVFIGGINLEQEGLGEGRQETRAGAQRGSREQKQTELKQSKVNKERKSSPRPGNQHILLKQTRQIMQQMKKAKALKPVCKQEIAQLVPWAVFAPEYQFY